MSEEEFPKVSLVCVAVPLSPITAGQAATEMLQEKKKRLWSFLLLASEGSNPACSASVFPLNHSHKSLLLGLSVVFLFPLLPSTLLRHLKYFHCASRVTLGCPPDSIPALAVRLVPLQPSLFQRRLLWKAIQTSPWWRSSSCVHMASWK